jgi:hypothetical protein
VQFTAIYLGSLEATLVSFIRNFIGSWPLGMGTDPLDASVSTPGSLAQEQAVRHEHLGKIEFELSGIIMEINDLHNLGDASAPTPSLRRAEWPQTSISKNRRVNTTQKQYNTSDWECNSK